MEETDLLRELEPTVERLYDRHLDTTKEWFPHEQIPYGRGRDGTRRAWTEADADLAGAAIDDAVRSSLIVNLLTEDNLPYYFRTIERMFGDDGAWGTWARRWTAEEGRHSMAIYGYLMVTRAVDPVAPRAGPHGAGVRRSRARARRRPPTDSSTWRCRNWRRASPTATRAGCRRQVGYDVMIRVAADENLHHLFYRDLAPRPSPSTRARWSRRSSARSSGSRCPVAASPASPSTPRHRQVGDLRPGHPPRTDPRPGRHAALGRRAPHRSRRRSRAGPGPPDGAHGQERARRPPRRRPQARARSRLTHPRVCCSGGFPAPRPVRKPSGAVKPSDESGGWRGRVGA